MAGTRARLMQANWIGRSEGAKLRLALTILEAGSNDTIEVYTTRPDTLLRHVVPGDSPPEHPLWLAACRRPRSGRGKAFVADCRSRWALREATIETGGETADIDTGLYGSQHPFIDGCHLFPVWIANFVLMEYGTGAIFGCPAHDQRDLDFARKYATGCDCLWCCRRRRRSGDLPRSERRSLCRGLAERRSTPGFLDGLSTVDAAKRAVIARRLSQQGVGSKVPDQLAAARLGHDPGNATGAVRSRSSIVQGVRCRAGAG